MTTATLSPREAAAAILRESAEHTLAELTNPAADLRTLAEQQRQSAELAADAIDRATVARCPPSLAP